MDKTDLVSVAFCCNNPDNGVGTGRFDHVNIGDDLINLVPAFHGWRGLSLSSFKREESQDGGFGAAKVQGYIKIARQTFPVHGYKYGWGNWCWDLYLMTPEDVIDLLNYLKSFRQFHTEDTTDEMEAIWDDHEAPFQKDPGRELKWLKEEGYQRP